MAQVFEETGLTILSNREIKANEYACMQDVDYEGPQVVLKVLSGEAPGLGVKGLSILLLHRSESVPISPKLGFGRS